MFSISPFIFLAVLIPTACLAHLFQSNFFVSLPQVLAHCVDNVLVSLGCYRHLLVPLLKDNDLSAVC